MLYFMVGYHKVEYVKGEYSWNYYYLPLCEKNGIQYFDFNSKLIRINAYNKIKYFSNCPRLMWFEASFSEKDNFLGFNSIDYYDEKFKKKAIKGSMLFSCDLSKSDEMNGICFWGNIKETMKDYDTGVLNHFTNYETKVFFEKTKKNYPLLENKDYAVIRRNKIMFCETNFNISLQHEVSIFSYRFIDSKNYTFCDNGLLNSSLIDLNVLTIQTYLHTCNMLGNLVKRIETVQENSSKIAGNMVKQ